MVRQHSMFIFLVVFLAGCQAPSASNTGPLEGAWQLTSLAFVSVDGATTDVPAYENLILFAGNYYSMAYAFGDQRIPFYTEKFNPTDEEALARIMSMTVNTGTFEVAGSKLTIRPLFALVPEFVNGLAEFEYKLSRDTLTLTWLRIVSQDGFEPVRGKTILTLRRM